MTAATKTLSIDIAAPADVVWASMTHAAWEWWPADFHTSPRTKRFVIEATLGGRAYEDHGNGDGLVWYTVIAVEAGRDLWLAGHLFPPFGGPAITSLRLTLERKDAGTTLTVVDTHLGEIAGHDPVSGWSHVFGHLKRHVESLSPSKY